MFGGGSAGSLIRITALQNQKTKKKFDEIVLPETLLKRVKV
jgi:hypothetical protein